MNVVLDAIDVHEDLGRAVKASVCRGPTCIVDDWILWLWKAENWAGAGREAHRDHTDPRVDRSAHRFCSCTQCDDGSNWSFPGCPVLDPSGTSSAETTGCPFLLIVSESNSCFRKNRPRIQTGGSLTFSTFRAAT